MKAMKLGKAARAEIKQRMNQETKRFGDDGFPVTALCVFFNVLTWYITHRAVSLNHRVEMERRLGVATGGLS